MSRCNTMQYSALDAYSVYFFRYPTGTPNRPPPTCSIMLFSLMTQTHKTPQIFNLQGFAVLFVVLWRKERDSNPRNLAVQRFSRPPRSTTPPSFRSAKVAPFFHTAKSWPHISGKTLPLSQLTITNEHSAPCPKYRNAHRSCRPPRSASSCPWPKRPVPAARRSTT